MVFEMQTLGSVSLPENHHATAAWVCVSCCGGVSCQLGVKLWMVQHPCMYSLSTWHLARLFGHVPKAYFRVIKAVSHFKDTDVAFFCLNFEDSAGIPFVVFCIPQSGVHRSIVAPDQYLIFGSDGDTIMIFGEKNSADVHMFFQWSLNVVIKHKYVTWQDTLLSKITSDHFTHIPLVRGRARQL